MKKRIWILIAASAAMVAGAAWYIFGRKSAATAVLETEQPRYGYIARNVTATGTIEPVDTVTVGSQVSGTIQHIYADYNSVVKKGQLIAQLDKSLLRAQANQYAANLEMAKAQQEF